MIAQGMKMVKRGEVTKRKDKMSDESRRRRRIINIADTLFEF